MGFVRIRSFIDPLSRQTWQAERFILAARFRFGSDLRIMPVANDGLDWQRENDGLLLSDKDLDMSTPASASTPWTGNQPCNSRLVHELILAAQTQGYGVQFRRELLLQKYVFAADLSRQEQLFAVAQKIIGLDSERLQRELAAGQYGSLLDQELAVSQLTWQQVASGSERPAAFFEVAAIDIENRLQVSEPTLLVGDQLRADLVAAVEQAGALGEEPIGAAGAIDALQQLGSLTTPELQTICGCSQPNQQAELMSQLLELVESQDVKRQTPFGQQLWSLC